jgi:uncharacterized membrane protein
MRLIAGLDRLTRNVAFVAAMMDDGSFSLPATSPGRHSPPSAHDFWGQASTMAGWRAGVDKGENWRVTLKRA